MAEKRWLRWIGPGLVAVGGLAFVASTTVGASVRPWVGQACGGNPVDRLAASRDAKPTELRDLRAMPWFRLDPILDKEASIGQRLTIGLDGERAIHRLDLANESFAAGPFGRIILTGSDDGTSSRLEALDVAGGCSWALAEERSVIRRATIDANGTYLYEMRVDRATRDDLGVWRRRLDAVTTPVRVLPPPPTDARFGRTFSTEFMWDAGADALAVQSCAELGCRTRVLDRDGAPAGSIEAPELGLLIGFDGDRVISYAACRGLPCPIVAASLATGERRTLVEAAGRAVVIPTPAGARLVHETSPGPDGHLRAIALDGADDAGLGPLPEGLRLHADPARTNAATRVPAGWVLLAPDGRMPTDPSTTRPQFRHVPDGSTVPFDEAMR